MQPVSMLMSNLNVEANTHHAPNALAAAQDTGQSQEIIRDGIKVVQTVQASVAASEAQRVHRKNENDQRDERENKGKKNSGDTLELTHDKAPEKKAGNENNNAPLLRQNVKSKKSFEFYA